MMSNTLHLIETDSFPFEFLSEIAERESWRKEIHRPIYHVHKWWAKRLGSVFRGILLGSVLPERADLKTAFYRHHAFSSITVFDPFMGSGTTIGEAHKLGFTSFGRDINPVPVEAVRVALGPMDKDGLESTFDNLSAGIGEKIRSLYRSLDSRGRPCDVLYYFWVMEAPCPRCLHNTDLFSSYVIAANAYPSRKPGIQILCPACGDIFPGQYGCTPVVCRSCGNRFHPERGSAKGSKATCLQCNLNFPILQAINGTRPTFRLYGKLVLTMDGEKEYLSATDDDQKAYERCSRRLDKQVHQGNFQLPTLALEDGYNTNQSIKYGFRFWRDFFNDRQLLALGELHASIVDIPDTVTRNAFLTLFSSLLEFNNMFASYKGEGTGAVRHMFSHHILKPERTPIEANVWGTPKSSGSFLNLFTVRLLRAIEYRLQPTEVNGRNGKALVCAPAFTGKTKPWPEKAPFDERAIYLSCGDSTQTGLPDQSIDLVVTDPPFFDNVHYSELADFFFAWQQIIHGKRGETTRSEAEVQDTETDTFTNKLKAVFHECHRLLKDNGLLVFTYHHSRDEGWKALANAVLGAGFVVVNAHPIKSEMSVAIPKSQAKEPIQLDIILICRKSTSLFKSLSIQQALSCAQAKIHRLETAGFQLSRNDRKIVFYGQLLTTLSSLSGLPNLLNHAEEFLSFADHRETSPIKKTKEQVATASLLDMLAK